MKRRSLVSLALLLFILVIAGFFVVISSKAQSSHPNVETTQLKTAPPGPVTPAARGTFSVAEARVYAWQGQIIDGERDRLPVLDREMLAALERMRPLLDLQRLLPGAHLATVTPGGTFSIPASKRRVNARANVSTSGEQIGTLPGAALTGASGGAKAVTDDAVSKHLEIIDHPGSVTLDEHGHAIHGQGVWAAIRVAPGNGLPVRIADRGTGGYVVALYGEDFGTIRINGGLVVPGRYYQINDVVEITGEAAVNIHIRPLSAVPEYHDRPLLPPSANG